MIDINKEAIRYSTSLGPDFGAEDFGLLNNLKKGVTYANDACNYLSNKNLELTGGKGDSEYFDVEECEVYKVIY